jgi:hypothetical protein
MKNIILTAFAFFTISFCYSQEWKLIDTDSKGQETYIRLHTENTAWFKTIPFQVPKDFSKYGMDKKEEGYVIRLHRFDCKSKKMGTLAYYYYNMDGEVTYSYEYEDYEVKMSYVVPDSTGEFFVNKFCELN